MYIIKNNPFSYFHLIIENEYTSQAFLDYTTYIRKMQYQKQAQKLRSYQHIRFCVRKYRCRISTELVSLQVCSLDKLYKLLLILVILNIAIADKRKYAVLCGAALICAAAQEHSELCDCCCKAQIF